LSVFCRELPKLETRRELLQDAIGRVTYPMLHCTAFNAKPADLIWAARELELEGVIAKRKGSQKAPIASVCTGEFQRATFGYPKLSRRCFSVLLLLIVLDDHFLLSSPYASSFFQKN
jgi:hypothetical protein